LPILLDWRLQECDYGRFNGGDSAAMRRDKRRYLDQPYPGGESWRQAISRVAGFLDDLPSRWDGQRVLVIGHIATRWALDHVIDGVPLEDLLATDFGWREGWGVPPVEGPDNFGEIAFKRCQRDRKYGEVVSIMAHSDDHGGNRSAVGHAGNRGTVKGPGTRIGPDTWRCRCRAAVGCCSPRWA
jgi:hypothetical protein